MLVQRLADRSASGLLALFPSRADYWLVSSHAHERALRDRYMREHDDPQQALEALACDNPTAAAPAAITPKEDVPV